jgi:hypothetical protein
MGAWTALVTGVALSALPLGGQATARYAYLDGAHWNLPPSPSGPPAPVLIVDTTGDPRAQEALRAFQATWNGMREDPAMAALPLVQLRVVAATGGCGRPAPRDASGATARVVVCLDDALHSAAVGGPYLVDDVHHTALGVVKLRRSTLSWTPCHLRTAVAHELGHVMGLDHNDADAFQGGPSLMMSGRGPYRHGCPVWFNAHDRDALAALYRGHAARCSLKADAALGSPAPVSQAVRRATPAQP